ncbi:L-serine ammonia-lyase [Blastopirellula sp. JC732]|uniref:L-serine dehydratase n=2 Tax=Blastopirellula sediminis TaxID=2894196 RepID=A0A9X1SEX6_9BACT|nr:L-serine ammonia-lyase [Blastopirellula sediminis]MCC9609551.1 L-serine ammonia-lyase [Blastopirellula sediminis]MCC9627673.1 L-serine ammonia-lyase [Blastopirellula sediminis]
MISVFELFTIGIGPSSSHSVGPMRAAHRFLADLAAAGQMEKVARVQAELYGSLALTGIGHGTDKAVLVGLEGETPEAVDPESIVPTAERIESTSKLNLAGQREIPFDCETDLLFHRRKSLPAHPNGLKFTAYDAAGAILQETAYYSIGGGFVVSEEELAKGPQPDAVKFPYPFEKAADLLRISQETGLPFSGIMLENEKSLRSEAEVREGLKKIWEAMQACVEKGLSTDGVLPGGLKIKRRAHAITKELMKRYGGANDPLSVLDWVNAFAMAVNEENAAGGRVVTAPTNGAAGIIPAVLHYYARFCPQANEDGIIRFLLTAGAIAVLYKKNASISGAEVGCQGEVGVACSMAAAALTEVLGGTPQQVEQAAEIGMEHNLGLTCDPIGGLVQAPCIERNAMGATKAINASRLALRGDGTHHVSLDRVINVMRRTGADMSKKYKETSRGGLAVNWTEC